MLFNSPIQFKFSLLLLLVGFIVSSQKMSEMTTGFSEVDFFETKLKSTDNHTSMGCLEYSGYIVSRETGNPIVNAIVEVNYSVSDIITTTRTDHKGFYKFKMPGNEISKIEVFKDGYSKESRIVRTTENFKSPSLNNRIYLTPFDSLVEKDGNVERIKVNPFYLDSKRSTDTGMDKLALEKVLFTMLKFPEIKIKIESHSNEGNTDISNSVLAYFHTKAARRYLILNGIDALRIESAMAADMSFSKKDEPRFGLGPKTSFRTGSDFIIVSE